MHPMLSLSAILLFSIFLSEVAGKGNCITHSEGIQVYTDFSGGSAIVKNIDEGSCTIRIAPESNPDKGWECWWYFRAEGLTCGSVVTIEVEANGFGLPDRAQFSYNNKIWNPISEPGERKERTLMDYRYNVNASTMWFAWGPPFVLNDAIELLNKATESGYGETFELARSREGRSVLATRISQKNKKNKDRPVLWIQARQHA
jgi:hypothetical protein